MFETHFKKPSWERNSLSSFELDADNNTFNQIRICGLVMGNSVLISVDNEIRKKLEMLMIGTAEIGKDFADALYSLLNKVSQLPVYDHQSRNSKSVKKFNSSGIFLSRSAVHSSSERFVVHFSAEEALYLAHYLNCLQVYRGVDKKDIWIQEIFGFSKSLKFITCDELLHIFTNICPCFPFRYLSYVHYKSKGWFVRSGLQFGSDFLLYKYHPKISHSCFSILVIPTAVESFNKTKQAVTSNRKY